MQSSSSARPLNKVSSTAFQSSIKSTAATLRPSSVGSSINSNAANLWPSSVRTAVTRPTPPSVQSVQQRGRVMMPLRTAEVPTTTYGSMPSASITSYGNVAPLTPPKPTSSPRVVSQSAPLKAREIPRAGYGNITPTPIASSRALSPRALSPTSVGDRQIEPVLVTPSTQSRCTVAPLDSARIRHRAPSEPRPVAFPEAPVASDPGSGVPCLPISSDHPICLVEVVVTSENRARFLELMKALVTPSLEELGCIRYELLQVRDEEPIRYILFEEWRSQEDLENHKKTKHFSNVAPEIFKIAKCTPTRLKPLDLDKEHGLALLAAKEDVVL